MFETLQQQISELDNQKRQLLTTIQNEIVGVLDKYPEFIAIRWTQYSYINCDGESCTFSLNEPEYYVSDRHLTPEYVSSKQLAKEELEDYEESVIEIQGSYYPLYEVDCSWDSVTREYVYSTPEEMEKSDILSKIYDALYSIEDLLEEQFGKQAEVIVTKKEIIVNSYNCDD